MALENNTNKQILEKIKAETLDTAKNNNEKTKDELLSDFDKRIAQAMPKVEIAQHEQNQAESLGGSKEEVQKLVAEDDASIANVDEEIAKLRQEIATHLDGGTIESGMENKEGLSENNILNPNILDKVAQMEAIDPATGQFSQERYDDYMNNQSKLGTYSVGENQKRAQEAVDMGDEMDMVDFEAIYGVGGMNRYMVDQEGNVHLSRGGDVASGGELYKTALLNKARELGIGTN
jgi:ParB-like chromosome segregation protein Spo0J